MMDDVLFNQWSNLASATGIDSTTPYRSDATGFRSGRKPRRLKYRAVRLLEKWILRSGGTVFSPGIVSDCQLSSAFLS
jgi:hypothetical protein